MVLNMNKSMSIVTVIMLLIFSIQSPKALDFPICISKRNPLCLLKNNNNTQRESGESNEEVTSYYNFSINPYIISDEQLDELIKIQNEEHYYWEYLESSELVKDIIKPIFNLKRKTNKHNDHTGITLGIDNRNNLYFTYKYKVFMLNETQNEKLLKLLGNKLEQSITNESNLLFNSMIQTLKND